MKSSSLYNIARHVLRSGILRGLRRRYRNLFEIIKNPELRIYSNVSIYRTKFHGRVTLYDNVVLHGCQIGCMTYIQSDSLIINCSIGSYCSIAHNVKIGLGIHPTSEFVSTHPAFYSTLCQSQVTYVNRNEFTEFKKTYIGSDVLIGCGAIILDGIRVGDGAIIGAGSVVTKDVEPYSIVGGIPARLIKFRFSSEQIKKLLEIKWYQMELSWILNRRSDFHSIDNFLEKHSDAHV